MKSFINTFISLCVSVFSFLKGYIPVGVGVTVLILYFDKAEAAVSYPQSTPSEWMGGVMILIGLVITLYLFVTEKR